MVYRQPFPGPGLGVRCLGAITRDRLEALRESDAILREEFAKNGLEGKVWQYFTVVPDVKSVGVRDGKRADEWPAIIRAVNTVDAMTATVENVPFDLLQHITYRITHEVKGINRVLYELTPKPTGIACRQHFLFGLHIASCVVGLVIINSLLFTCLLYTSHFTTGFCQQVFTFELTFRTGVCPCADNGRSCCSLISEMCIRDRS